MDGQAVPGYHEEAGVAAGSTTETFVALRLDVDNWRRQGFRSIHEPANVAEAPDPDRGDVPGHAGLLLYQSGIRRGPVQETGDHLEPDEGFRCIST